MLESHPPRHLFAPKVAGFRSHFACYRFIVFGLRPGRNSAIIQTVGRHYVCYRRLPSVATQKARPRVSTPGPFCILACPTECPALCEPSSAGRNTPSVRQVPVSSGSSTSPAPRPTPAGESDSRLSRSHSSRGYTKPRRDRCAATVCRFGRRLRITPPAGQARSRFVVSRQARRARTANARPTSVRHCATRSRVLFGR